MIATVGQYAVVAAAQPSPAQTAATRADALIRAKKYDAAKTFLESYLKVHPADAEAHAMLGVTMAYLGDPIASANAFDGAGARLPDAFKGFAAKAYADAAVAAFKAKDANKSVAFASKGIRLERLPDAFFIRATAYVELGDYPHAIADFEQAKAQATAAGDKAALLLLDTALVRAYAFGGQFDKSAALAADVKKRDAANTRVDDILAEYFNARATDALAAGKRDDAVALYESGAVALPSRAVILYVAAASALSNALFPDWKRVKAEADKALAIDPLSPRANYIAAVALESQGDRLGALALVRKAKNNLTAGDAFEATVDGLIAKLEAPAVRVEVVPAK
ncbi:MAG: hypothetical protein GIW95_00855 [Candidatus Eremiobacteraeota bacterium]|nr:hypothetical protein [Candidatus Eremiobacteraeota bacterium]